MIVGMQELIVPSGIATTWCRF